MSQKATEAVVSALPPGDIARTVITQMTPTQLVALNDATTTGTSMFNRIGVARGIQQNLYATANRDLPSDDGRDGFDSSPGEDNVVGGFQVDREYVDVESAASAEDYRVNDGLQVDRGALDKRKRKRPTALSDHTNGILQVDVGGTHGRSGAGVASPWGSSALAGHLAAQRQPAAVPAAARTPTPTALTADQRIQAASCFKKYTTYAKKWCVHAGDDTTFYKQLKLAGLTMLGGQIPDTAFVDLLLMTCTATGEPSLTELAMVANACDVPVPDDLCDDDSEDVLGHG